MVELGVFIIFNEIGLRLILVFNIIYIISCTVLTILQLCIGLIKFIIALNMLILNVIFNYEVICVD